jgi:hypothetical protein
VPNVSANGGAGNRDVESVNGLVIPKLQAGPRLGARRIARTRQNTLRLVRGQVSPENQLAFRAKQDVAVMAAPAPFVALRSQNPASAGAGLVDVGGAGAQQLPRSATAKELHFDDVADHFRGVLDSRVHHVESVRFDRWKVLGVAPAGLQSG